MAYDTKNDNKKVAVKILNDDLGEMETKLLHGEIEQMKEINHRHVIKYLDHGNKEYINPKGTRQVSFIALETHGSAGLVNQLTLL